MNIILRSIVTFVLLSLALLSCTQKENSADLIISNATIWTGNEEQPHAEALAVKGDTFIAVGSYADIIKYQSSTTEHIDAQGQFITPGFIDTHVHFLYGGFALSSVQLRDAQSPEEFVRRIKEFAESQEPGTWILGGDWDHENWGGELPTKDWIDQYTPNHPVWVTRLDGHMALANSAALKIAGIDNSVKNVVGGTIVRDLKGNLTGIFKDNAMDLVLKKIPPPSPIQLSKALQAAMTYAASNGVTSVHHVDGDLSTFQTALKDKTMITRIYAMLPLNQWQLLDEKVNQEGQGNKWLKIGALKGFVDGSLGSHTAAFFSPYTDVPADSGFFITSQEQLYTWISQADKVGLQLAVHAIGDKAINTLLNIYEQVEKENGKRDRRFRVEHAQHISPADIPRFAQLNVIPSMQPYHAIDDGRWAERTIGPERIKTTYAFKSLFDAGAKVAFGSDWTVAPAVPLEGIYAAITRRTLDDKNPGGWVPDQKINIEEALKAYTINAAYASFDEKIKGSLEAGKLADFVIIDQDITKIAPEQIKNSKIKQTFVGGQSVYKKQ